jgi:hypothetical protein
MQKLNNYETEARQFDITLKVKEEEKRKELEIMKEFYQKKIDEAKTSDNSNTFEKEKFW